MNKQTMDWRPAVTPGVLAIGYYSERRILMVKFCIGLTVFYQEVPYPLYVELLTAHDKKRYIYRFIDKRFIRKQW